MGRPWTEIDITKLKSLAGRLPVKEIVAELGRSSGATILEAHKLGPSLRRSRSVLSRPLPNLTYPTIDLRVTRVGLWVESIRKRLSWSNYLKVAMTWAIPCGSACVIICPPSLIMCSTDCPITLCSRRDCSGSMTWSSLPCRM